MISEAKINPIKAVGIFVLVALFLCYEMAVQVSPGIITHELMRDLQINALMLGIISGVYFYSYTLMQIPAGLLYDRFNVRWVILIPLLVCVIGTFFFAIATSPIEAALARLLMGTGSAFAFIGVLVVAADIFPRRHFALLAGIAQMLAAFGAMGGQLPLVGLIHWLGWRYALITIAFVGLLLVFLIGIFVRYRKAVCDHTRCDTSIPISKSLSLIVKNPQTWFIAIYACLLWAPMSGFASLWGVPYLESAYNLSAPVAAGIVSLMWFNLALASPLIGWFSDFIERRKIPLILCALLGVVSFTILLFVHNLSISTVGLLVGLAGASCAGQALSFALVRDNNPEETRAAAIGFNNMAVVISGAIFQPLIGKLIQSHWTTGTLLQGVPLYTADNYQYGLLLLPAGFLVALLVCVFCLKETSCKEK